MAPPPRLKPVPRPARSHQIQSITLIAAFAALAIVGRVAFLWAPNYALTHFVVFSAGVLLGPLAGIAVALIAMTTTNIVLSGFHPILLANGFAMAMIGLLGGLLRPVFLARRDTLLDRAFQIALLGAIGLFATLLFSVLSDLMGFVIQFLVTPEGATVGTQALVPMLLAGLIFNLGPAIMNLLLFATATPALIHTLQQSGHLPRPTTDTDRQPPSSTSPTPPTDPATTGRTTLNPTRATADTRRT